MEQLKYGKGPTSIDGIGGSGGGGKVETAA